MTYLFFQIWLWILASFALGWIAHWFLCCRGTKTSESDANYAASTDPSSKKKQSAPLVNVSGSTSLDE